MDAQKHDLFFLYHIWIGKQPTFLHFSSQLGYLHAPFLSSSLPSHHDSSMADLSFPPSLSSSSPMPPPIGLHFLLPRSLQGLFYLVLISFNFLLCLSHLICFLAPFQLINNVTPTTFLPSLPPPSF